jgi:arylsulfatase A-like enzyme
MASLWSGLTPQHVGVTRFNHTVPGDIRMPAEILSEAGFKTIGLFRNGWVNGYFGFDQGFEKYYRPLGSSYDPRVQRLRPNAQAMATDQDVVADAIEFLRIHGTRSRWFLYLHLMDLHEYTYDAESALFGSSISDLYDNSLRRTDWVLSTLYDYLVHLGLEKKTIIVLLSDHGEAFGERGFEGHAREVFPETTETPLILSLPFALPEPVVVRTRTDNLDVWPTLLALLGLPDQGAIDGRSRVPEILAAAGGRQAPPAEVPATEAPEEEPVSIAFLDENWGSTEFEAELAVSIIEGPYRYVTGTSAGGGRFEVLLSIEDGQRVDRAAAEPKVLERLRATAKQQMVAKPRFQSDVIELDEMQLDQLRALGYELP